MVSAGIGEKEYVTNAEPGLRAPVVDTYSGNLDPSSSPTWDRGYGSTYDASCNLSLTDSASDGEYYEVIPIQVTANENLECEVTAFDSDDTVIVLYCDPFDPSQPLANAIAYDDDDGSGNLSAFTAADGVALSPGNTYYLVVSGYNNGDTGAFTVDFTSATVAVVPVELQSFSIE
jgi:hypothetical protein